MSWPWGERAAAVERARKALVPTFDREHAERVAEFHRAIGAAWPPGFFEHLYAVKRGEQSGLDAVLEFLEAAPYFFRSGYIRDKALRWVARPRHNQKQAQRLEAIVLAGVQRRWKPKRLAHLARALDSRALRDSLRALAKDESITTRARAEYVLRALGEPPPTAAERASQRVASMLATAFGRRGSETLLRRILAVDPATLSALGHRAQAVAFESAMNLNILSEDELLATAQRIDGPEMDGVWRFGTARTDTTGELARRLFAQVRT